MFLGRAKHCVSPNKLKFNETILVLLKIVILNLLNHMFNLLFIITTLLNM